MSSLDNKEMCVELAYKIGDITGWKCDSCGKLLVRETDDGITDPPEFNEWEFCPYCGRPLYAH